MTGIVENKTPGKLTYQRKVSPGVKITLSRRSDKAKPWLLELDNWDIPIGVNGHIGYYRIAVSPDDLVTIGNDHTPVDLRGLIQEYHIHCDNVPISTIKNKPDSDKSNRAVSHGHSEPPESGTFDMWTFLLTLVSSLAAIGCYVLNYPMSWVKALVITACLCAAWFEYHHWKPIFKHYQKWQ